MSGSQRCEIELPKVLLRMLHTAGFVILLITCTTPTLAQDVTPATPQQSVTVVPEASDAKIASRLQRILKSTGWFDVAHVSVHDGIVFLDGTTGTQEHRAWAGTLAENMQGTVAVVNRIEASADVSSTFVRAGEEFTSFYRRVLRAWPLVALAGLVILASWHHGIMADRQTYSTSGSANICKPHRITAAAVGCSAGICSASHPTGYLFRTAIFRVDATGPHCAWRHWADRRYHRLRTARHYRELSGKHPAKHAQPLPQR